MEIKVRIQFTVPQYTVHTKSPPNPTATEFMICQCFQTLNTTSQSMLFPVSIRSSDSFQLCQQMLWWKYIYCNQKRCITYGGTGHILPGESRKRRVTKPTSSALPAPTPHSHPWPHLQSPPVWVWGSVARSRVLKGGDRSRSCSDRGHRLYSIKLSLDRTQMRRLP